MHSFLLLLQAAPEGVSVLDVVHEYIGFLAYFGVFGALGFRYFVLGRMPAAVSVPATIDASGGEHSVFDTAAHRAAWMGFVGSLLFLAAFLHGAVGSAANKHMPVTTFIANGGGRTLTPLVLGIAFALGFVLALGRVRAGWVLAALAGIILPLRGITSGKWTSLVNPFHETAASLWLGTLLVLVVAGLPAILRSALPSERRGALVADLIARFSPVALFAAGLLGITGIITAWLHLKYVAALWTTSYGITFDIKLALVAVVLSLGAWNWRRMSPRLGEEEAAHDLRRSAKTELAFAALVLLVTAVLVSLPTPKLPHP